MPTDVAAARRRFNAEQEKFRATVAAAVAEGQRKTDIAADAGISRVTLDAWIRQASSRPMDEG